ncbi:hypothetical protein NLU13_8237 [Sarocladium strictum]|uniref:histidine kinase n=1 Tax=Sarocladium strictum TaxID=5046 RepID=A0AA39GCF3_SARSR|nr:hypothetical protein NLU13_8237 [Sarocladium strictum]
MTPPEPVDENHPPRAIRPVLAGDESSSESVIPLRSTKEGHAHQTGGGRFLRDPATQSLSGRRSTSQSPFRLEMPALSPAQLAFSAMQYLPVPVMILNNLKTVVQANEAMARMLDLLPEGVEEDPSVILEKLRGQTLSQVGIDMLQDGRPVWLTWDTFFDAMVDEMGIRGAMSDVRRGSSSNGASTPTVDATPQPSSPEAPGATPGQNAVVEVVISRKTIAKPKSTNKPNDGSNQHIYAKMIISIWEVEERQPFFTLTFTSSQSRPSSLVQSRKSIARPSLLEAADRPSITNSNTSSVTSSRDSNSPSFHSPGIVTMSSTPFPPMGPPAMASQSSTPSLLQKMMLIKDAILDNTEMPILAMWKDGSATFPNKAARKLFGELQDHVSSPDGSFLIESWQLWNEDFTHQLQPEESPIAILIKTETPFSNMRIGTYHPEGHKVVFDVLGEAIRDDSNGEFLAGVITCRDVTTMTEEIVQIKERDEEREEHFRLICDTMPQMVWTATPDGMHDYFNSGWYEYTGLTQEESMGLGWQIPFHSDDLEAARPRWLHALETETAYEVEYRCKSKDGEWRWFLGRAAPARNKETGEIEKWFGTCTDVHDNVQTKIAAAQTREQLLGVLKHGKVTLLTVDTERRVTLLEGSLIWDKAEELSKTNRWLIGQNMYAVFNRLTEQLPEGERPEFLQPIEDILDGKILEGVCEHRIDDQWYRTRFIPYHTQGVLPTPDTTAGVIGVIMDVTEIRRREEALQRQSEEKRKAVANEAAAKEATRLKSQFLANMSHEIRTPITGVLGMAELLGATQLDEGQRDFVDNIQSSATSLLTVINDILDFSKVESGRLDIEEVQFSLSLIVKEVGKMLQFAVERKNLDFRSDIDGDIKNDMVVIGDPGRVRQIITNLLTNSIKFTNQGYVRFSVDKERETADSVEVRFTVEDTGIGIQEEVRKRLFQPFSQGDASTARRFGGTGLGLTICKNLLDLMQGRITLRSTLGKGTTATFWIPFHKPSSPQTTKTVQAGVLPDRLQSELSLSCNSSEHDHHGRNSPVSSDNVASPTTSRSRQNPREVTDHVEIPKVERSKILVLVVEDNAVNQKFAIYAITKMGFQVKALWNGKEALDYLMGVIDGKNVKPDIILMDVQMPTIDGYKCTHILRHHMPYKALVHDVAIVAMTASAIYGDREKAFKAGMDDYVSKPVTGSIIEHMITRWTTMRPRKGISSAATDISTSDCSEVSEHCENAEIPGTGIEDNAFVYGEDAATGFDHNSPITPRPLTTNGGPEPSPFDSIGSELGPHQQQQVRRQEGEQEWTSKLQENKMLEAAGGPKAVRASQKQDEEDHRERLTEENMSKLENAQPR